MQARGKVARYESDLSTLPTALEFSGEGDLTPVTIHYVDDIQAFKKGGLVKNANRLKAAGRYGDTELVHVNKEELDELRELWGEPTINPETGLPEYFLKKLWKGVKKVAKPLAKIAPIAAMFIPGIGPLAAAGIGALSGGITGGWKGALTGGALGGLGASGALGKAVGSIAPGLSPVAQRAATGALSGALGSAVRGDDILGGALMGGGLGAAIGPGGIVAKGPEALPIEGPPQSVIQPSGQTAGIVSSEQPFAVNIDPSRLSVQTPQVEPWLRQPFLGGAISPKINNLVGYGALAALASSALKSKPKGSGSNVNANMSVQEIADKRLQDVFRAKLPEPKGMYANLAARDVDFGDQAMQYLYGQRPERSYYNYVPQFKKGGSTRQSFAVRGKGTGRSDEIPALLSDGEYVIDAETVALLGDGSNDAGAKRLDDMRVNLRKHKGKNLAKGKFSVNAKKPEAYMAGGYV